MLRREVEVAKKRYQDLKDEKETLVDQQVGSSGVWSNIVYSTV